MSGTYKMKLNRKKSMGVLALTNACVVSSILCSTAGARTLSRVSRIGSSISSISGRVSSISRVGSTSSVGSNLNRQALNASNTSLANQSNAGSSSSNTALINSLNARLSNLEAKQIMENQRANNKFNKVVMASGIVSSGMLVAGIVGGVAQQIKFRDLADQQAKRDQEVQEDLTDKRYYFQEVEIPEAEQYIIDYYQENYGIDITK